MSIYSIALFLHIIGALGFFVVQGVEWMGLSQLRSTKLPEEARAIIGVIKKTNRLGFVSILTTVTTGIYMMLTVWRGVPWILVVLGSLVLEIVIFVVLSGPRMTAIEQALATEESRLSKTFHTLVNHPILWISVTTRMAILLGIVFLKIAKPGLGESLLAIGIAIVLGLVFALLVLRHERVQAGPATRMIVALFTTIFIAALVVFAAKSISPGTIPSKTNSDVESVQTQPSEVTTEPGSSNRPTQISTLIQSDVQNVPAKRSEAPTEVPSSSLSTQGLIPSPVTATQEGSLLLQTRCTQCHSLQTVLQAKKARAEWENTLLMMKIFGTKISDSEKKVLLDYLTTVNQP